MLDLAADRFAVRTELLRAAAQIQHLDLRDSPLEQIRGKRLPDHRAEVAQAAWPDGFLQADVVVQHRRVDPQPGEGSALPVVEDEVQRPGDRDLSGAGAEDVLDDADSPPARAHVIGDGIAGAELEHAEAGHEDFADRNGNELEGASRRVDARLLGLLEEAIHVADESAVAAAREHRAVPLVEHLAGDGARVVETAGVIEVFGRNEVLQLALQGIGNAPRIRVEEHRHPVGAAGALAPKKAGDDVLVLVRSEAKGDALKKAGVKLAVGELGNPAGYAGAAWGRAAFVHVAQDWSPQGPDLDRRTISSARDLLRGQVGATFIYTSGCWVQGPTDGVADESTPDRKSVV